MLKDLDTKQKANLCLDLIRSVLLIMNYLDISIYLPVRRSAGLLLLPLKSLRQGTAEIACT